MPEATGSTKFKRRRLQGACDICRQKKIRCDSAKMPDNRCSNCIAFNAECTHIHISQKTVYQFKPSARRGMRVVEASLTEQRTNIKPLLDTILSPTYQAPTNPAIVRNTLVSLASYVRLLEQTISSTSSLATPPASPRSPEVTEVYSLGDEVDELTEELRKGLVLDASHSRFFGPSSNANLVQTAMDFRDKVISGAQSAGPIEDNGSKYKRPEFWTVQAWELSPEPQPTLVFPEPDLLDHLVDVYFRMSNIHYPLLHRPTVERSLKAGLHLKNPDFGQCVLAICAVASRYSNDKRVIGDLEHGSELSCGFQWYRQIRLFRDSFLNAPTLYELQTYVLVAAYLHGSSAPEKCWYVVGMGIRAAQDAGIHRLGRDKGTPPTVQRELQKRLWWSLYIADIIVSVSVGRPHGMHSSEYDIDLPIECDDEYWENEDPSLAFKQPPGKPAQVASMIKLIELLQTLGTADHAFYPVKKPEPNPEVNEREWEQRTLADLDSALNAWVDSIPDHLRWDPLQTDPIFFDQSAMLFCSFYWVQIMVHRPFIMPTSKISLSSFAICTNAARACSRIMDIHSRRGFLALPQVQGGLLKSGLVLLLSIWRGKQAGIPLDEDREMEGVHRCSRLLSVIEKRWHPAGRFNDVLRSLSAVTNLPLPDCIPLPPTREPQGIVTSNESKSKKKTKPMGSGIAQIFDYPVHSKELSKPIFQSYQHTNVGAQRTFDDFEAMFSQSSQGMAINGDPNGAPSTAFFDAYLTDEAGAFVQNPVSVPGGAIPVNHNVSSNPQAMAMDDITQVWAGVPNGFENWSAWSTYFTNVEALNQENGVAPGFQMF